MNLGISFRFIVMENEKMVLIVIKLTNIHETSNEHTKFVCNHCISIKTEIFWTQNNKMIIMPTLVVVIMDSKPLQHVCGTELVCRQLILWLLNKAQIEKIINGKRIQNVCPKRINRRPNNVLCIFGNIYGSPYNLKSNQY